MLYAIGAIPRKDPLAPRAEPPPDLGYTVTRLRFPVGGIDNVRAKMRAIRQIVNEDRTNPRIRGLAAAIFREAGLWDPKLYRERAAAILRWAQHNIIYVHEPIETFTRPRRLLLHPAWRFGDCDEFTSSLMALYESVGYPTQQDVIGWKGSYRHIFPYVGLPPGGGDGPRVWVAAEGTKRVPFGWSPKRALRERLTAMEDVT